MVLFLYFYFYYFQILFTDSLCQANVQAVPNLFEGESGFSIADLYLDKDKLKGWSMSQHQSLTGFEKIRVVGKGNL